MRGLRAYKAPSLGPASPAAMSSSFGLLSLIAVAFVVWQARVPALQFCCVTGSCSCRGSFIVGQAQVNVAGDRLVFLSWCTHS